MIAKPAVEILEYPCEVLLNSRMRATWRPPKLKVGEEEMLGSLSIVVINAQSLN
jgi:hypothetical protein